MDRSYVVIVLLIVAWCARLVGALQEKSMFWWRVAHERAQKLRRYVVGQSPEILLAAFADGSCSQGTTPTLFPDRASRALQQGSKARPLVNPAGAMQAELC
jgi:hypothetical protein